MLDWLVAGIPLVSLRLLWNNILFFDCWLFDLYVVYVKVEYLNFGFLAAVVLSLIAMSFQRRGGSTVG